MIGGRTPGYAFLPNGSLQRVGHAGSGQRHPELFRTGTNSDRCPGDSAVLAGQDQFWRWRCPGAGADGGQAWDRLQHHRAGTNASAIGTSRELVTVSPKDNAAPTTHGYIAVDKFGCQILFINAETGAIETVPDCFPKTVHELLVRPEASCAYVPIFGYGIHGSNPHPGHQVVVIDVHAQSHVADIDVSPLAAPHAMRIGPDGLIYVACEDSGVVAIIDPDQSAVIGTIDAGSRNCHRLEISPDGARIHTEEDRSVSVIDLHARKLLGQIKTPHAPGELAASADSKTVIAADDEAPALFLIDAELGEVSESLPLEGLDEPAQIARHSPDFNMLALTSMAGDRALLIDADASASATGWSAGTDVSGSSACPAS